MNDKFLDQVLLKQDDRYTVAITKDHNKGIVVQVARMNPTHVRGDNGASYKGHEPVVLWQYVVPLMQKNPATGQPVYLEESVIKSALNKAVQEARQYAQKAMQAETSVDNMLQELNKDERRD